MPSLTIIAAVKNYLTITTSTQDALIDALIDRESAYIEQWTGRTFPYVANINKRLNGSGSPRLVLPDNPIIEISSLSISGNVVAASPDALQTGFIFDDTCIYLIGSGAWGAKFPNAYQSIICSWTAGYSTSETAIVPAGTTPSIAPTSGGKAATVLNVSDATTGIALSQVANSPASGQFSFADGTFTFNSAQASDSVTMSYCYVPSPVEQVVIEMVGLDLQQRSNIGINSKSLANETVTYEKKGMTASAQEMLMPYRRRTIG